MRVKMLLISVLFAACLVVGYSKDEGSVEKGKTVLPAQVQAEEIAALIKKIWDGNADVRGRAIQALGEIGPAAVPILIKLLEDEDSDVRSTAAYALGKMGPAAKDAVPALITALTDEDENVRGYAARALGYIGRAALPA